MVRKFLYFIAFCTVVALGGVLACAILRAT
jgi:hypothetical protein